MSICSNCGNTLSAGDRFCNVCGTPVSEPSCGETEVLVPASEETTLLTPAPELTPAPAYDPNHTYKAKSEPVREPIFEPAYTPPAYKPVPSAYPTYAPAAPALSGKTKALGFVGMGLGIGGFALSILGILYVLIGLSEIGYGLAFSFALAFGIFSMPMSIVGRILAGRSQDEGNTFKGCSVGSALGLAGIIVSAVMLFLGFVDILSA